MQAKHIIAGILALAGLVFGAYNWYSYLKPSAPRPAVTAVRPSPKPEPVGVAFAPAPGPVVVEDSKDGPETRKEEPPREKVTWPDIVGRSPFLTPREIELIARGELVEEDVQQKLAFALPVHKLTGLILDRKTGNYRALIDGKAYATGDLIGPEEIVEITAMAVTLQYGGQTRTIARTEEAGKKSSSVIKVKKAP